MNLTELGFHKCAAYTPKQLQAVAGHTLERLENSYFNGISNLKRAYQSGHGRLGRLSKLDPSKFNEIGNKADSAWFDVTSELARRARNTGSKLKSLEQLNEDYQASLRQMSARNTGSKLKSLEQLNEDYQASLRQMSARNTGSKLKSLEQLNEDYQASLRQMSARNTGSKLKSLEQLNEDYQASLRQMSARNTGSKLKSLEQLNEDYQASLRQMSARRK